MDVTGTRLEDQWLPRLLGAVESAHHVVRINGESEKKVVIVTGASSGIGRAVAWLAARKGYRVVLDGRRVERLKEVQAKIEAAGGEALAVQRWQSISTLWPVDRVLLMWYPLLAHCSG